MNISDTLAVFYHITRKHKDDNYINWNNVMRHKERKPVKAEFKIFDGEPG